MANTKNALATLIDAGNLPGIIDVLGKLNAIVMPIVFASQASGDTIELGDLPPGWRTLAGLINGDTSTATATLALGISGTAGKYRAAAVFTAINAPALFGVFAGQTRLAAKERVIATVGTAALPAAGTMSITFIGVKGD
jgi:hypothetical protein